jgi:hypothetical protein
VEELSADHDLVAAALQARAGLDRGGGGLRIARLMATTGDRGGDEREEQDMCDARKKQVRS